MRIQASSNSGVFGLAGLYSASAVALLRWTEAEGFGYYRSRQFGRHRRVLEENR
jgi:hypothetical protein